MLRMPLLAMDYKTVIFASCPRHSGPLDLGRWRFSAVAPCWSDRRESVTCFSFQCSICRHVERQAQFFFRKRNVAYV